MIYGIKNGMIMQRGNDDTCDIIVKSSEALESFEFSGEITGKAEMISEEKGKYRIRGIPVGGPYTLDVDGEYYNDIYVGDVWVLAGQSNMQGVGWYTEADLSFEGDSFVRALYMEDKWGKAKHPLHSEWKAVDAVHTKVLGAIPPDTDYNGVGPGLAFGQRLYELTGVPQGLICSAHGGTSMAQWDPDIKNRGPEGSLYAAMQRRVMSNGGHIRGVFWFQGCADAFENRADCFYENTKKLINSVKADFLYPDEIPIAFIQVQLGRVIHKKLPMLEENWAVIREAQRLLSEELENVYTLSAINTELDDLIHISRESHTKLGKYAAETAYAHMNGRKPMIPTLFGAVMYRHPVSGWAAVDVAFDGILGNLTSEGRANGFCLAPKGEAPTIDTVYSISLCGNKATLRLHYNVEDVNEYELYYGYGLNPYANLTDSGGHAMPCFGPVKIQPK